ncbi:MAG TPA: DNA double-strand break repair nuclease NurA [Chloroflexi bacterium]|nr:DNA double-strand break repair nuclease NurA [Chloroflexota bacterium]
MSLPLAPLIPEIEELSREVAESRQLYQQAAREAREVLHQFAAKGESLRLKIKGLQAAIPAWEPLDYVGLPPSPPDTFTVIAADGSQIQPDRHGIALYYVINVGSIVFRHGSGQTPQTRSIPTLYYRDEDLYEGQRLVQGNLLDVRRDIAEMRELAEQVQNCKDDSPLLALADGTLILWVLEEEREKHLDKVRVYLKEMERIRKAGAALAGFTSRPRYTEVVDLLRVASLGVEAFQEGTARKQWGRLTDAAIFRLLLKPGQRSALFESPSPVNDHYGPHRIFYFYLNTGGEIARIEVPRWVAENRELLDFAHGAILKQGELTGGYPYVLTRAHELAVIKAQEKANLEAMIERALISRGILPRLSEKERWKRTV